MAQQKERLITVFGGGGFVGRYVVQALARAGVRIRVAQRDPRSAFFLKPLGMPGQIQFIAADLRDAEAVASAAGGAEALVNLVGILTGDFEGVHVDGARHVAQAAAAEKVAALVHVSAIGADPESPSRYGASKGRAEQAVRGAFPAATIIRPSVVFGMEDHFVNRFARIAQMLPFIPVIRAGTRFQPVYAADLGRAVAQAALDPRTHAGMTYELGGPQVISMGEINRWICRATGRGGKPIVELPDAAARLLARVGGWMPGAPITWDQWLMLQRDNVAAEGAPGFEAFGIRPAPLAATAEGWLTSFRQRGRFAAKSPY